MIPVVLLKKIVLITTTQPAVNPRIVKEADTFAAYGHDVTVLYCYVANWAQIADKEVLQNAKWKYKQVGGNNKSSLNYQWTRLKYGICKKINSIFGEKILAERAHARCYKELLAAAIKTKADLYIGHNPGAIAIAVNAAKLNKAESGFDFEDYHRGEYNNNSDLGFKRQVYLENLYINKFDFLSAASPLIKKQIESDFPALKIPFITLLNCFSFQNQLLFRNDVQKSKLKLCWFSQHIGRDRGLELLIMALKEINDLNIELSLIGNCSIENLNYFKKLSENFAQNINFISAVSPDKLFEILPDFDIGLALEIDKPLNRSICLTNKIFGYILAGNAIILTETIMQNQFNNEYKIGQSFPINDLEKLKSCILFYKDKKKLLQQRKYNYELAKNTLNWEKESKKILDLII